MRSQAQSRRILNGVMKSPSPDIANNHNIKKTETPISDVKKYLQRTSQSRSPRKTDISHSSRFSHDNTEVEMLRKMIKQLEKKNYEQIYQIQKFQQKIQSLERERENLWKRQNFVQETIQNKGKGSSQTIKQMQERVYMLLNQNTRLVELLKDKQTNLATMNTQYKILKNRIETLQFQLIQTSQNQKKSNHIDKQLPIDLHKYEQFTINIKNYYYSKIQPQMKTYENYIHNKFIDMIDKLKKIEQNQIHISKQISKNNTIITPTKDKHSSNSTRTNEFNSDQQGFPNFYATNDIRPFSSISGIKFIRDTETSLEVTPESLKRSEEIIQNLQVRITILERQNSDQRKKIIYAQEQLKRSRENQLSSFNIKPNESAENYIRKIRELQQELEDKNMSLSTIQRELNSLNDDSNNLKQKTSRQIFLLQNERDANKKAYEQEKQRFILLNQSYSKLMQQFHEIQIKLQQKQDSNSKIKGQIRSQLESRQENIKRYYEDLLKTKDRTIGEQLHQYLQILQSIRRDIEGSNIQQVIDDSELFLNDKINIEKQIIYIKQENQRVINQIKTKLIAQEQTITDLQKNNQLLQAEISELQKQKLKLKSAIFDFQQLKPMNTKTGQTEGTNKPVQNCKLKVCIKENVKRIDWLENKITNLLMD